MVRKLAGLLGGEKVFSALAASLDHESDLQFAASMVQALNLILLTAPEVPHPCHRHAEHARGPVSASCALPMVENSSEKACRQCLEVHTSDENSSRSLGACRWTGSSQCTCCVAD